MAIEVRSEITSRSNSAKTVSNRNSLRPAGLVVSIRSLRLTRSAPRRSRTSAIPRVSLVLRANLERL
jgi:hypothetical protein